MAGLTEMTLKDLPQEVIDIVFRTLELFVKRGPRGLAESGLFPLENLPVVEEQCAYFGGKFRIPPLSAPVYVFKNGDIYELDLPLWLEGEDDRNDLFIFLEIDPTAGSARMVDLYAP